jgi:hypothetical protein
LLAGYLAWAAAQAVKALAADTIVGLPADHFSHSDDQPTADRDV